MSARIAWLLLCLLAAASSVTLSACGPATPTSYSATERKGELEARLSQLPVSTEPAGAIERSHILRALGRQEQALEELSNAIDSARERLSWDGLASLWRELGTIHIEQGRPEKALDVFGKRLEAAVSLDEPMQRASALVDTAYAFALLGHVGQADEAVTEAHVLGGDPLMRDPVTVERLGLIADILNDSSKARFLLDDAAAAHEARGDRISAARARVMSARIVARDDGNPGALSQLDAAVAVLPDPEPVAMLRRYQAEGDLAGHNYDACERRARESLALADARGLAQVSKISRVLAARCGAENGHLEDAILSLREAGNMVEMELRHVTGDTARQHLGFEAFLIYRLLLTLEEKHGAGDRIARAFVTSERARARAHLDAIARAQLGSLAGTLPVPAGLMSSKGAAEQRVKQLTQALVAGRARTDLADRHRDALWALEDIKEAIARSNPLLSRISPPDPADIKMVRSQLLDADSVLLSYFVTDDTAYLFTIDDTSESLDKLKASVTDLDRAVGDYRKRFLLSPGAAPVDQQNVGRKLFDMVLGPAAKRLVGKKKLIIIPHGRLSTLPFESLVTPEGKFVVQDYDVVYSVSATVSAALDKKKSKSTPGARKAFVGMGDPVYDWAAFQSNQPEGTKLAASRALELWSAAEDSGSGGSPGLSRLPGTARELSAIAKLFGADQKVYLRAHANEGAAKGGGLSGYRLVHIASHGLLGAHYNALALTLNPNDDDDGFLINSEIADLKLDADLVVLSACRTGETKQQKAGEALAGLTLSLRSAGAGQVVLSLWSVDDDATSDLMVKLYKPLVDPSADVGHSLAEAKRKMIAEGKWAQPFYWAAFVLHGS